MIRTLLGLAAIFVFPVSGMAATPDLSMDDGDLIAHIKRTGHIFTTALGKCDSEQLRRNAVGGRKQFEYVALCAVKPAPEDDCPEYKVRAPSGQSILRVGLLFETSGWSSSALTNHG